MTRLILLLALAVLAGCGRPAADCGGLAVADAWVRAAPPGTGVTAGYFVAENRGRASVLVSGAASPDFERVEMHRTRREDGRTSMTPIASLEIAPGEREVFAPGGGHLMLFGGRDLAPGDRVRLELACGESGDSHLEAPAEVRAHAPGHGSGGHRHGDAHRHGE